MKVSITVGMFASIAALGCAPIASSGPKYARVSSHPGDSGLIDSAKYDLRVVSQPPVIKTAEEYEKFEKMIEPSYALEKIYEGDARKTEILETGGMTNLNLSSAMNRADIMVIFILKDDAPKLAKVKNADLALSWLKRTEENKFSFQISEDAKSDEAWTYVKKNLSSITIAFRAVGKK